MFAPHTIESILDIANLIDALLWLVSSVQSAVRHSDDALNPPLQHHLPRQHPSVAVIDMPTPRTTMPIAVSSQDRATRRAHQTRAQPQLFGSLNPSQTHQHCCKHCCDYDPVRNRLTAVILVSFAPHRLRFCLSTKLSLQPRALCTRFHWPLPQMDVPSQGDAPDLKLLLLHHSPLRINTLPCWSFVRAGLECALVGTSAGRSVAHSPPIICSPSSSFRPLRRRGLLRPSVILSAPSVL